MEHHQGEDLDHLAVTAWPLHEDRLQALELGGELAERRAVAERSWLALQDGQVVAPVEDRPAGPMVAGDFADMLGDGLTLRDENQAVAVGLDADGSIGKRRRDAVSIALERDQAGRRNPLGVLYEPIEWLAVAHEVGPLDLPGLPDADVGLGVPDRLPQVDATVREPVVEVVERVEGRNLLPDAVAAIADVLLDLALLPTRRRVAELGVEQVVADHGLEARVDVPILAASDLVDGRLHVVVDAPPGHAA